MIRVRVKVRARARLGLRLRLRAGVRVRARVRGRGTVRGRVGRHLAGGAASHVVDLREGELVRVRVS